MPSGHAAPGAVVAVVISMTVVACIFVGMRLYARLGLARNAGLDDLCIVLSIVFAIGTTITMIIQAQTGMGRHAKDVEPHEVVQNLQAFWVSTWVYNLSLTFTKVSILFQYLRIFPQRWFRRSTWVLMGVIVAYGIYVLCTGIWLCRPIAFFWDSSLSGGKCLDRFSVWFVNAALNIATDIATTILPLPVLNKLQLPRRQKRALMAVFALGGFTCILSILRLHSLYVIANTDDVTWNNPLAAIWSNVEMNVAVIASCLPTIRCLFPRFLKATSLGGSHSYPIPSDRSWGVTAGSGAGGRSPFSSMASPRSTTRGGTASMKHKTKPYQSTGSDSTTGFGAGVHVGKSKSHIRAQESVDDIELRQQMPFPNGRIHVMTSIEQATHQTDRIGRDSTESRKDFEKEKKPADCF